LKQKAAETAKRKPKERFREKIRLVAQRREGSLDIKREKKSK